MLSCNLFEVSHQFSYIPIWTRRGKYIKDGNDIPNITYRLLATKGERIMNSLDSLSFIALRILFLESSPQYMRKYEKGMRRYRCDSKQHANWIIRNSERRITYSATDKDLFIHKTIGNEEELLKEIHRLVKLCKSER